jgi:hypothetical protein
MDRYFIFQQEGAFPQFQREAIFYPNYTVVAWIGRGGSIAWPPRSPDLTSLDFSVWGYVEDKFFVPLLPTSLKELRARIAEDTDMFHRIWDEFAHRWDICCVTREKHIEQL